MSDTNGKLIMNLHVDADAPGSPMEMVSASTLKYYRQLEVEVLELRKLRQSEGASIFCEEKEKQ